MKKLLAILLAAASALSICAFTACDKDGGEKASDGTGSDADNSEVVSDNVTQSVWENAFSISNFLNVTVNYTWAYDEYDIDGRVSGIDSAVYMTDLVLAIPEEDFTYDNYSNDLLYYYYGTNAYIGNCCSYYEERYNDSSSNDNTSITTLYENITENTYSYVSNYIYTSDDGMDEEWRGNSTVVADDQIFSEIYYQLAECNYFYSYSDFIYKDGAYVLDASDDTDTFICTIKIKDGYIIYYSLISAEADYDNYYFDEYTFSDYGTTSVSIPEEYTYEYFSENNA